MHPCDKESQQTAFWAALGKALPADQGKRSFPSTQYWQVQIWGMHPVLGSPIQEKFRLAVTRPA